MSRSAHRSQSPAQSRAHRWHVRCFKERMSRFSLRSPPLALMLLLAPALFAASSSAFAEVDAARVGSAAPARVPTLRATFEQLPGGAGVTAVTALGDNSQAWAERWRLMSSARRTLDASYFIVTGDVFGRAFVAKLYERARRGVTIRF